ncbi:hypothetical protein LINGRAHAP2_LOCUS1794 [Linum grandiflorum]
MTCSSTSGTSPHRKKLGII